MSAPLRIQRSRAKGWRMPPNTIVVSRPSIFGNVSTCTRPHDCALRPCDCCDDARDGRNWCCVLAFQEYVESGLAERPASTGLFRYMLDADAGYPLRKKLIERLPTLRGFNLCCWCHLCAVHRAGKPFDVGCRDCDPCHADVLGRLANR